jgi:hypothetical protein
MAAATGNSIFTDIEESWAIYRWHLRLGKNKIFVVIPDKTFTDDFWGFLILLTREQRNDQTFTDDWGETRCLPTSKDDVYRHQKE